MDSNDYLKLEELLGKLRTEVGKKYCIIPDYVQDGFCIATYDSQGDIIDHYSSYDIETVVEKIKGTYKHPYIQNL
jgi:hypothetical protein